MRKKILLLNILLISLFSVHLKVNADGATSAIPGADNYSSLQSLYNSGIMKSTISSSDWVTIYGKSVCDSNGSCAHYYVDNIANPEKVLSKSVVCSGGQKYIKYDSNVASGKSNNYTDANNNNLTDDTVYWSEVYYVTCTDESTDLTLETTVEQETNVGNNYNSATPGEQKEYGVNTYYIVLGSVAIVSYVFMIFAKKFNLFKKI